MGETVGCGFMILCFGAVLCAVALLLGDCGGCFSAAEIIHGPAPTIRVEGNLDLKSQLPKSDWSNCRAWSRVDGSDNWLCHN